ncbi:MAG: hypothetical protein LQ337_007681 [Flavoplaca oasis]|nr:MAG: hypothetical protein LQ337_007681 [Flavoplaca oasis]
MSSSEDADSESSGASFQSAQPQDDHRLESERSPGPSSDELLEDASDPPALGARSQSDHSSESGYQEQVQSAAEQSGTSSEPKGVTPSRRPRASFTRPNKYHGPPSTWRDWTAAERQIVASLDQLRAKDLSAHLYNFYCLKRRTDSTQQWQGETDPDTDEYVSISRRRKAWLPVKTWTAWPMDPQAVPRESDESTWEGSPHERHNTEKTPISSSELLSDLLTARACKKAKEHFYKREWEDSDAELPEPPSDRDSRKQLRIPELAGDTRPYEPVVMADDELAKSILQPSINHVLYKLDTLLMGLHHARNSYATVNKMATHSRVVTDDESSMGRKRKRKAARTSVSRASSRKRSPDASGETSEAAAESATSFSRLKRGLGLRDWSDVLGVASVSGFPPDVVARTAERCSNLFDESIVFRTLYEGKKSFSEVKYAPDVVPVETLQGFLQSETEQLSSQDGSEEEKVGAVHVDGFMQPISKHKTWSRRSRSKKQKL